jgi:hypothetical protein
VRRPRFFKNCRATEKKIIGSWARARQTLLKTVPVLTRRLGDIKTELVGRLD